MWYAGAMVVDASTALIGARRMISTAETFIGTKTHAGSTGGPENAGRCMAASRNG
jgi:hypothetical protein